MSTNVSDAPPAALDDWVIAVGLETKPVNPKQFAFDVARKLNTRSFVVDRSSIHFLNKPVTGQAALLLSISERPSAAKAQEFSTMIGGISSSVMHGERVWRHGIQQWRVRDVVPEPWHVNLDDETQVLWDLATGMAYQRHCIYRKPQQAAEFMSSVGARVLRAEMARRPVDKFPMVYDAVVEAPPLLADSALVSIGKHRMFSGLAVPA